MKSMLGALRRSLENATTPWGLNYGEFARARKVPEFLIDASEWNCDAIELAARTLVYLLSEDRNQQMDFVVCVAVVTFLDKCLGEPREDSSGERRTRDLWTLVSKMGGHDQYLRWARSWYEQKAS